MYVWFTIEFKINHAIGTVINGVKARLQQYIPLEMWNKISRFLFRQQLDNLIMIKLFAFVEEDLLVGSYSKKFERLGIWESLSLYVFLKLSFILLPDEDLYKKLSGLIVLQVVVLLAFPQTDILSNCNYIGMCKITYFIQ